MLSMKNGLELFMLAALAAARAQMVTAFSLWATVGARLALQIKLTAWTWKARRPRTAAPAKCAKRRQLVLDSGKSFFHAVLIVERAVISHALQ